MDTQTALDIAGKHLQGLAGNTLDLLTIAPPKSAEAAVNLAKIISKLSPLLGNMIEVNAADFLNQRVEFAPFGRWKRQDPGFPDVIFDGRIAPAPGFEIKAWFPLATEITGRFKDSQSRFEHDQTHVAVIAWLPEHLIYGQPRILDVCIVSGISVARARDEHYHDPPRYVVIEPGDTADRTANLQQTNTSGYVFQGKAEQLRVAEDLVRSWGEAGISYSHEPSYQAMVANLIAQFAYRLDTNYAKIDRIEHLGIEAFKTRVLGTVVHGLSVKKWGQVLGKDSATIEAALRKHLGLAW